MKEIFTVILIMILIISGCIYQGNFRPDANSDNVWICEELYAEYYWSEQLQRRIGKIVLNDKEYNVLYGESYGSRMIVYSDYVLRLGDNWDEYDPYELFRGRVNYEKDCFTLTVEEDKQNIFGGEKPVMKFVKHDKEKYFNGKNIEVKNVEHRNK